MEHSRIAKLDNFRAFLIICVVAGHLCEVFHFPGSQLLYLILYAFHMPAFAALSGLCSGKPDMKKAVKRYVYPYVVFQTLYWLFRRFVLKQAPTLQFTTPTWLLWYLLAAAAWQMLLPLFQADTWLKRLVLFCVAVALALGAGYFEDISYYMSLSRILVMFPFFLGGYYLREPLVHRAAQKKRKAGAVFAGIVGIVVLAAICCGLYFVQNDIDARWLYASYPYKALGYGPMIRGISMAVAAVMAAALYALAPSKNLFLLTGIGQRTMAVYVLHGFVILALKQFGAAWGINGNPLFAPVFLVAMVLLFSVKPVSWVLTPLLRWPGRE